MTSTILSHRPTLLKTMAPLDAGGYAEGLRITACLLDHGASGSIELDRAELRAVLRELPTALLLEVLGERGIEQECHTTAEQRAVLASDNPFFGLDDPAPCEER